jgi:hypothetical protein
MAVFLGLGVRALWRVRDLASVLHESLVWLLLYLLVGAPFVLPWYLSWLLPLTITERDPRWRRLVAVYSGLSVVEWCADLPPLQPPAGQPQTASRRRAQRQVAPRRNDRDFESPKSAVFWSRLIVVAAC